MSLRVDAALEEGIRRIRSELGVPTGFPPAAAMEAVIAAKDQPGADHVDRTDRPFITLDPPEAIDLDQAFAIERSGGDLILHYAIADVGWFVEPGSSLNEEAWKRGVTVYLPDQKSRLYPAALSEGAASLLPDGPRPAVVFTTRVDGGGEVRLEGAERALVHSRAKLAYDTVAPDDLPDGFADLAARIEAAEDRRGAPRVEFPDQELEQVDGSWVLRIEPRRETEDHNAALSLATNLAVANALLDVGTGLFRVMAEPTERQIERLRHTATAFGLRWPHDQSLADFRRTLHRGDPAANGFLLAVRRAGGGASYEELDDDSDDRPWHSAIAAPYVHATAPLRRLADRYVVDAGLAVGRGEPIPEHVRTAFGELPRVMARAEGLAHRAENAVIALAEAVLLAGREQEVFDAVVVDEDHRGTVIQLVEPAVLAHVTAHHVAPGDAVRVRLVAADIQSRTVEFSRVS